MLEVPSLVGDSEQTTFPVIQGVLSKLEYSGAGRKSSSQPRGASTLYHSERAKYDMMPQEQHVSVDPVSDSV